MSVRVGSSFVMSDDQLTRPTPALRPRSLPDIPLNTLMQTTGRATIHWVQATWSGGASWILRSNTGPAPVIAVATVVAPAPAPVPAPTPAPVPAPTPAPLPMNGSIQDIIVARAYRWGVSASLMLAIASCESSDNPNAYNPSGASGLFQWMPTSYWSYAAQIGETRSYWDADAAANVAAYTVSIGGLGNWAASQPCWGG